jgi:hypothetical protein
MLLQLFLIKLLTIMILQSGSAYVQINVTGRGYPNSSDYWDGNWLESEIKLNTFGFKCVYSTSLRADDFQRFYEALLKLNNSLTKEVEFTTMEEGLYLKGQLDITGNIKWEGVGSRSRRVVT